MRHEERPRRPTCPFSVLVSPARSAAPAVTRRRRGRIHLSHDVALCVLFVSSAIIVLLINLAQHASIGKLVAESAADSVSALSDIPARQEKNRTKKSASRLRGEGVAAPDEKFTDSGPGEGKQTGTMPPPGEPPSDQLLSCDQYGGPTEHVAVDDIVYWSRLRKSDTHYKSPFYDQNKYLTFEPDRGGWNNARMALENVLVLAHAMGRTLVLPPVDKMKQLDVRRVDWRSPAQKAQFSFKDFLALEKLAANHDGLNVLSMEEFLRREGLTERLKNSKTGKVTKPPMDQVNWDGDPNMARLYRYLSTVALVRPWAPTECLAAIPASPGPESIELLNAMMRKVLNSPGGGPPSPADFIDKPVDVQASAIDRLRENLAERKKLCVYDEEMQNAPVIHFNVDRNIDNRLLVHFYSFVFFENWTDDLWTKRFVRDNIRYLDELMCAGARVVEAVRTRAREADPGNPDGFYDSFHIRRGDFKFVYKGTRVGADVIYELTKGKLKEGSTVFIATDEADRDFFKPLAEHYKLLFLSDFTHLLGGLNTNYYGMLDQLVCTRSRVFTGTWFSTFTGYINRLRGYYVEKHKLEGHKEGIINSWYYPEHKFDEMRHYFPPRKPFFMREFPAAWRSIDKSVDEI